MAHKIQIKRGNKADLPTLDVGEFGLCQDTNELFIGNNGNQKIFPPTAPTISDVEGLQTALDNKVDNSRVLTNVPVNAKFTDTTYSEISTSEIDAGTSSTLRTITGRRVKYLLDKVQGWINALTKSDIGLGNVENYSIATQAEAEAGTSNTRYTTPLRVKQAINIHNTDAAAHNDIRQQINSLAADVDGHAVNGVHQKVEATSTDDATSAVNAPLKTAGGLAVAKNIFFNGAQLRYFKSGNLAPNEEFTINVGGGFFFLMVSNTDVAANARNNAGMYIVAIRYAAGFVELIGAQRSSGTSPENERPFTVAKNYVGSQNQIVIKNTSSSTTVVQVTMISTALI